MIWRRGMARVFTNFTRSAYLKEFERAENGHSFCLLPCSLMLTNAHFALYSEGASEGSGGGRVSTRKGRGCCWSAKLNQTPIDINLGVARGLFDTTLKRKDNDICNNFSSATLKDLKIAWRLIKWHFVLDTISNPNPWFKPLRKTLTFSYGSSGPGLFHTTKSAKKPVNKRTESLCHRALTVTLCKSENFWCLSRASLFGNCRLHNKQAMILKSVNLSLMSSSGSESSSPYSAATMPLLTVSKMKHKNINY